MALLIVYISNTITRPDTPWGPPRGVNRLRRGVDHTPPSSALVKERVEPYIYSPSRLSWPVLGRTLPFMVLAVPVQWRRMWKVSLEVRSKHMPERTTENHGQTKFHTVPPGAATPNHTA